MKKRTFEDAVNTIRKLDKRTEKERASRLQELGVMSWSTVERPTSQRISDYSTEASMSYVNGCYRSCIFCCSATVDQIFRHEIILESKNPEEKMAKLRGKPFGTIIRAAKNLERLQPFLSDAQQLNNLRNKVAVHPLCFWPFEDEDKIINEIIIQDIKNIIAAVDHEDAKKIRQSFIIREDGKKVILADVLCDPSTPEASDLLMWRIDNDVLKPLALKAFQKMAEVIEGLYPAED